MLLLRAVMNTVAGQFQIQQGKAGALINDYMLNKKNGLMIVAVQSQTATRGQVLRMTAKGWAKKTILSQRVPGMVGHLAQQLVAAQQNLSTFEKKTFMDFPCPWLIT
jgi:hypothetical protein